jgi:hypothetical protein
MNFNGSKNKEKGKTGLKRLERKKLPSAMPFEATFLTKVLAILVI